MIEFDDPKGITRRKIVERRELFASLARFIIQVAAGLSLIAATWLTIISFTWNYLIAIGLFMVLMLASAQDLMYRGILGSTLKGDDIDDDPKVDLSGVRFYRAPDDEEDDDEL